MTHVLSWQGVGKTLPPWLVLFTVGVFVQEPQFHLWTKGLEIQNRVYW